MEIKFELVTVHGEDVLMRTAVNYMDDELREEIHAEWSRVRRRRFVMSTQGGTKKSTGRNGP